MVEMMASKSGCRFSPGSVGEVLAAQLGVGVEHGEVELVFVRVEIDEEVVDLVEDFLGAGVGAIDFVDDEDGEQLGFERLGEDVAGLRQGAFGGVDQQHDPVDHFEGALDFTAEIGVAGGVDDVDLVSWNWMAVFLARMVMPRSFSSSFESMTRSVRASLARKVPAWRNMASTRVVLPWSTWAMMAILRMGVLTGAEFLFFRVSGEALVEIN